MIDETTAFRYARQMGPGVHSCGNNFFKRGGYLTIEIKNSECSVLWTTGKETHNLLHRAIEVTHKRHRGVVHVCMSAMSMWTVYNEDEKEQCVNFIIDKIEKAYKVYLKNLLIT